MVHVQVTTNETHLAELDSLQTHIERQWNDVVEHDNEPDKYVGERNDRVGQVPCKPLLLALPDHIGGFVVDHC